jgi:hypothetical protein
MKYENIDLQIIDKIYLFNYSFDIILIFILICFILNNSNILYLFEYMIIKIIISN